MNRRHSANPHLLLRRLRRRDSNQYPEAPDVIIEKQIDGTWQGRCEFMGRKHIVDQWTRSLAVAHMTYMLGETYRRAQK